MVHSQCRWAYCISAKSMQIKLHCFDWYRSSLMMYRLTQKDKEKRGEMVARVRSTCIISTCSKFLPVLRLQSFNHSARRIFGQAEEVARKEGISIRPPPTRRPPPRADDSIRLAMSIQYVRRMSTYPVAREVPRGGVTTVARRSR